MGIQAEGKEIAWLRVLPPIYDRYKRKKHDPFFAGHFRYFYQIYGSFAYFADI